MRLLAWCIQDDDDDSVPDIDDLELGDDEIDEVSSSYHVSVMRLDIDSLVLIIALAMEPYVRYNKRLKILIA